MNKETAAAALNKIIATPAIWSVVMLCGVLYAGWRTGDRLANDFGKTMSDIRTIQQDHAKAIEKDHDELTETLEAMTHEIKRLADK